MGQQKQQQQQQQQQQQHTLPEVAESILINHKGNLQQFVQALTRRPVAREEIEYTTRVGDGGWIATVIVRLPVTEGDGFLFEGEPRPRRVQAEQVAAARALAHLQKEKAEV